MVYAGDLKSPVRKGMRVRVPPAAHAEVTRITALKGLLLLFLGVYVKNIVREVLHVKHQY